MKGQLIKELHAVGVYRDPKTKVKLESMKTVEIAKLKRDIENGVVAPIPKDESGYIFITPMKKADKIALGSKKRK